MSADSLTRKKILDLLDYHESCAGALRMTLDMLDGEAEEVKQRSGTSILERALAVDTARVKKRKRPHTYAEKQDKRAHTAAFLAGFSTVEPTPTKGLGKGLGGMISAGYLKYKDDGVVRTKKEFIP